MDADDDMALVAFPKGDRLVPARWVPLAAMADGDVELLTKSKALDEVLVPNPVAGFTFRQTPSGWVATPK